jgi:hypothetical protein
MFTNVEEKKLTKPFLFGNILFLGFLQIFPFFSFLFITSKNYIVKFSISFSATNLLLMLRENFFICFIQNFKIFPFYYNAKFLFEFFPLTKKIRIIF